MDASELDEKYDTEKQRINDEFLEKVHKGQDKKRAEEKFKKSLKRLRLFYAKENDRILNKEVKKRQRIALLKRIIKKLKKFKKQFI